MKHVAAILLGPLFVASYLAICQYNPFGVMSGEGAPYVALSYAAISLYMIGRGLAACCLGLR